MTHDDWTLLASSLMAVLGAGMIGYLVGTWPRKRQPVQTIDMTGMGETTRQMRDADAAARAQQTQIAIWERNAAEAQTLANALTTESPVAEPASPGTETAAAVANAPVEAGRPDQEAVGPAASLVTNRPCIADWHGAPIPGALLFFSEPVFMDEERLVPHPIPIVADSMGSFPPIYMAQRVLPRVPCATPHIDEHAPGFAARARKTKPKKKPKR